MPITKKEFEKGKITKPIEVLILNFLKKNSNKAYTIGEIINGMDLRIGENIVIDFVTGVGIMGALESLEQDKKISKKNIEDTYYYAIR